MVYHVDHNSVPCEYNHLCYTMSQSVTTSFLYASFAYHKSSIFEFNNVLNYN